MKKRNKKNQGLPKAPADPGRWIWKQVRVGVGNTDRLSRWPYFRPIVRFIIVEERMGRKSLLLSPHNVWGAL